MPVVSQRTPRVLPPSDGPAFRRDPAEGVEIPLQAGKTLGWSRAKPSGLSNPKGFADVIAQGFIPGYW